MPNCSQCGGELKLTSEKSQQFEGHSTAVTVREYKCLNQDCQGRIDKETQLREKTREDRLKKSR